MKKLLIVGYPNHTVKNYIDNNINLWDDMKIIAHSGADIFEEDAFTDILFLEMYEIPHIKQRISSWTNKPKLHGWLENISWPSSTATEWTIAQTMANCMALDKIYVATNIIKSATIGFIGDKFENKITVVGYLQIDEKAEVTKHKSIVNNPIILCQTILHDLKSVNPIRFFINVAEYYEMEYGKGCVQFQFNKSADCHDIPEIKLLQRSEYMNTQFRPASDSEVTFIFDPELNVYPSKSIYYAYLYGKHPIFPYGYSHAELFYGDGDVSSSVCDRFMYQPLNIRSACDTIYRVTNLVPSTIDFLIEDHMNGIENILKEIYYG